MSTFVAHYLLLARRQIEMLSHGASQKGLYLGSVRTTNALLPPLDLQQKFSDIVKEAEAQIATQTKATTRINNLFQALLHSAFNSEL